MKLIGHKAPSSAALPPILTLLIQLGQRAPLPKSSVLLCSQQLSLLSLLFLDSIQIFLFPERSDRMDAYNPSEGVAAFTAGGSSSNILQL